VKFGLQKSEMKFDFISLPERSKAAGGRSPIS